MILPDVNVLIYAFSKKSEQHQRYRAWLDGVINASEPYGVADIVLSGVLRIVSNPRFSDPISLDLAIEYVNDLRGQSNCVVLSPGERHWHVFIELCRRVSARGNLVTDAYLAALAIESDSELITTDRDFARFPGLRWRHPFES